MKRNKKRSSILKRPSISSNENSPGIDAAAVTVATKRTSKRISFSGKSKVKEFACGDNCATIWNNSYEKSAEHCSASSIVTNESTVGPNLTMKPPPPILSGPNKENIMVSDLSLMGSVNVSMSATLSATLQFDSTMAMNNLMFKSPGKIYTDVPESRDKILDDSMELEDIQENTARKTIFNDEMSLSADFLESNDTKLIVENKSKDMEMSLDKNLNQQSIVFDKANIEQSQIISSKTLGSTEINTEFTKKRNRRQTKIELQEMDLSEVNVTPTVPAKRDKKDIGLRTFCNTNMDVTLTDIATDARKTIVFHNDQMVEEKQTRARETIVLQNDENMFHPEEHQKLAELKKARSLRLPFQPAKESIYIAQEMQDTLVETEISTIRKTEYYENDQMILEDTRAETKQELVKAQNCRSTIYTTENMSETLTAQKESHSIVKQQSMGRKTKHFENDPMAIEKDQRRQTTLAAVPMNESLEEQMLIEANSKRKSTQVRGTIYGTCDINETMANQNIIHGLLKEQKTKRQTTVGPVPLNESDIETEIMIFSPDAISTTRFAQPSTKVATFASQETNETLVDQVPKMSFNGLKAIESSFYMQKDHNPTKICRQTVCETKNMNETLIDKENLPNRIKEKDISNSTRRRTTIAPVPMNDSIDEYMTIEPKMNTHKALSTNSRETIYPVENMNETMAHQKENSKIVRLKKKERQTTVGAAPLNESDIETENITEFTKPSIRGTIYVAQDINETLFDSKKEVKKDSCRKTQYDGQMVIESISNNIQKVPKICRKTTYNAVDMNETLTGQQKPSVPINARKTEHFVDESMAIESNKTNRRQTTLASVPINDSLDDQMLLEPNTNKPTKTLRGTIYASQDMNETLECKKVDKNQKSKRQTNVASIAMNESDIDLNLSKIVQRNPSKTSRGTIYIAQEINETLINETIAIDSDRKRNKNIRPTIYTTEDINETLTDEEKSKKSLQSMVESDMETTQNLVLQAAALTNIPPRLSRGSIYVHKEIDDTLLEDTLEKSENIEELSKNCQKRNRRVTTLDNLSMNLSSLNVTPTSNIPRKKERKGSPSHQNSVRDSDVDLTLANLSLAPNAHSTHHDARIVQDMNLTKSSTQKSGRTPSKIPIPGKMRLEPKLTQGTDERKTIFNNKSIEMEKPYPQADFIDSDDMEETLVAENNGINELQYDQPDSLRRQTVANPTNSIRYSNIQMAELSTRRFKDLTMQDNQLLDKESDINLTLSSTLTEPVKSDNASVYVPCSYANITLEKVVSPNVSINPAESSKQVLSESCVCSETSMQENSFSVSKISGISPNVSIRLSLGNEVVEQIRQRVLKQTPLYCKNCKCMSESRINQSTVNSATSTAAPLINWASFAQVPLKISAIDEMEKDFLKACQPSDTTIKQYPEIPSIKFLLENLRENLNERIKKFEEDISSTDNRCPAPFPSAKPFEFLIKNKLECENLPWTVTRSLHAPIGKFQLRNNKLKSVLLHFEIEPNSLKSKEMFVYQSVKFIKNVLHPPSSPFTAVLFDTFIKMFPLETSVVFMCQNSNSLFEFLFKIDKTIAQMHANIARLFSILIDHKINVYIEKSNLVAKASVIDDGLQIIRVFMNLADPNNFQLNDIRTEPDVPHLREFAFTCNLKGIEFLEYFLSNIKQIVLNK